MWIRGTAGSSSETFATRSWANPAAARRKMTGKGNQNNALELKSFDNRDKYVLKYWFTCMDRIFRI
jgi:hypothetical protein